VDPPASKEPRLFGLTGWTLDRFIARRTRLHELQYAATRLRQRPVIWSVLLVVGANVLVFWLLAGAAVAGRITLGEAVVYVQGAIGVSLIAFGSSISSCGLYYRRLILISLYSIQRPGSCAWSSIRPASRFFRSSYSSTFSPLIRTRQRDPCATS